MGVLTRSSVALALVFAACAPEANVEGNFDDQQVGTVDGGSGDSVGDVDAQIVPTIDGTWLHYHQMSTCVDLGQASVELVNRTLYIVESEESADEFGTLTERWTACDIELSEVFGLLPRITPALLEHGFPFETRQGLVTGTSIGARYASGAVPELWGLEMDEPASEPMPSNDDCTRVPGDASAVSCDDDRIIDMDRDGNPGATLRFNDGVCEAYVVQRTTNFFQGQFVRPDRIEGNPDGPFGGAVGVTGQVVLDATTSFCTTEYETRSNDAFSGWARQRIDGRGGALNLDANGDGSITCDEVVDAGPQLFARRANNDDSCER